MAQAYNGTRARALVRNELACGDIRVDRNSRLTSCARAARVQLPMVPTVTGWIAETPGAISLGQGMVGFGPPESALVAIPALLSRAETHRYQPDPGVPELRRAFADKLRRENGLRVDPERRIMVTAGANQAFLNTILCICDPGDEVILLTPYYFNHEMAIGLAGCRAVCVETDVSYQPRLDAIAAAITQRTRAVVTVSPNNPTGAVYSRDALTAINRLCSERGLFHISDEAYEYFTFDGAEHFSPGSLGGDAHTISIYSLSKAYGFAGWRVGFEVIPEALFDDLLKIQDSNSICATALSQLVAIDLLRIGRAYCDEKTAEIAAVRARALESLAGIGDLVTVPEARGAFYFLVRIATDARLTATDLAERLVREHGVGVIPGETFGMTDGCYLRISYGALSMDTAMEGMDRLVRGLRALCG